MGGLRLLASFPNGSIPARPDPTPLTESSSERVGIGLDPMPTPPAVLLIDANAAEVDLLRSELSKEGFQVAVADTGHQAIELIRRQRPDLVILEGELTDLPSLELCRAIRTLSTVPVIFLSSKSAVPDKVAALELGADDYVTKPFSIPELLSRVRAWLRRVSFEASADDRVFRGGPVEMDALAHEVRVSGKAVRLTPKEFELLELLLRNKGKLLRRTVLISDIWGNASLTYAKSLDAYIKRLRQKIEKEPHVPKHIVTVRGLGYKFVD